jgi:uncharacterized protein (DUF433 family)
MNQLLGIGTYTPSEAAKLLAIPAGKISRWVKGHRANTRFYEPLWTPEIEIDGKVFLGFRDLMEIRVANAFIREGLSSIQVRRSILLAREIVGNNHPLATNRFRTDGREVFLSVIESDERGEETEKLLNLFRRQYEFKGIIDPILKTVDFGNDGQPLVWWPKGRSAKIAVDPERSFGQPIESTSSVPTAILAAAAQVEGIRGAAEAYEVTEAAVRRSLQYQTSLDRRLAA